MTCTLGRSRATIRRSRGSAISVIGASFGGRGSDSAAATFYKIGYQLGYAGGLALAERLAGRGLKVFLDPISASAACTLGRSRATIRRSRGSAISVIGASFGGRGSDPWFEAELLPVLRAEVARVMAG
jgi:hypothetical protein